MKTPVSVKRRHCPRAVHEGRWTLADLQEHLQYAIDLELWTIPYYLTALYSIKSGSAEAQQLVRTVANQEMLHMQLAANLANAYGCEVCVSPPVYDGTVPHLDFSLDKPDPTRFYKDYSPYLGPFDQARLDMMCLIEYPDWSGHVILDPDAEEYGSIGDFYHSVAVGAEELKREIRGNRNQLNVFQNFYPDFEQPTVTRDGAYGFSQVQDLINAIVSQGEGRLDRNMLQADRQKVRSWLRVFDAYIPPDFQNPADDLRQVSPHYEKFTYLQKQPFPEVWTEGPPTPAGQAAQERLRVDFARLCQILQSEFRGEGGEFSPLMFQIGADIVSCWKHGALPTFS